MEKGFREKTHEWKFWQRSKKGKKNLFIKVDLKVFFLSFSQLKLFAYNRHNILQNLFASKVRLRG